MKTWKECQTVEDRNNFLDSCQEQRSWFGLTLLALLWFISFFMSSCGYVGKSTEYVPDTTNYERPYVFIWNHHSYLRFGWIESQSMVHNPDCLCHVNNRLRDYQLNVTDSGTHVYDRSRYVGFVPFTENSFDILFTNDNL